MAQDLNNLRNVDLVGFIKTNWLQFGFVTKKVLRHQTKMLTTLFETFCELHQFPKLVSKLFLAIEEVVIESSGGIFFNQAYIHVPISKTFAKCVSSLPIGQTYDIWKLFAEFYFESLRKALLDQYPQAAVMIVAQLFSTFLLHSQLFEDAVFPIVYSKSLVFLQQTHQALCESANFVFRNSSQEHANLQISFLLILCSYREVKHAYNIAAKAINIDSTRLDEKCCGFDFLPSHEENHCSFTDGLDLFSKERDKRFVFVLFKLLIQKSKEWVVQEEDGVKNELAKSAVKLILPLVLTLPDDFVEWDYNINNLNEKNYGAALWFEFLQHLPFLAGLMDKKELTSLCSSFISILVQEEKKVTGDCYVTSTAAILKFIESRHFTDSKDFQSAFVTALWAHCGNVLCSRKRKADDLQQEHTTCCAEQIFREMSSSPLKWIKYAESTPKCNDKKTITMWNIIQTSCDMLNKGLNDASRFPCEIKIKESLKILKMINYLPLEYLTPGNQMRCLLGLSTIFFCLANSHCEAEDSTIQEVVNELCKLQVAIFEGVRSIWLFDFIEISPYMSSVVAVLKKLPNETDSLTWPQKLLFHLFKMVTKQAKQLELLNPFVLQITSEIHESTPAALSFLCICHRLVQLLNHAYLHPDLKRNCESLASYLCSNIAKCMKHFKRYDEKICSVLVKCYADLVALLAGPSCNFNKEEKEKWLKSLPKITEFALEAIKNASTDSNTISDTEAFTMFILKILTYQKELEPIIENRYFLDTWNVLCSYYIRKSQTVHTSFASSHTDLEEKIDSKDHFLCLCYSKYLKKLISNDAPKSSSHVDQHLLVKLSELESSILSCLAEKSSDEEFKYIIQDLLKNIETCISSAESLDVVEYQLLLQIFITLTPDSLDRSRIKILSKEVQKVLTKIHFLLSQACSLQRCLLYIVIPSLNFISFILKKKNLDLPKICVVQCIHSFLSTRIESCIKQPAVFILVFQSLWNVLNELLLHHTFVFIHARYSFIPCITMLLKSVIVAGNQDVLSKHGFETQQKIELCAQNVDRLLTSLANYPEEFSKMVPYIISEYVDSVQHVTIHPSIKAHIVSGINRLLNICSAESVKMLAVNINHSCREIYTSLVKNNNEHRAAAHI